MVLFGLFFAYNLGMLFIAFIRHFKRTLILTLILTILSGIAFLYYFMFWIKSRYFWIVSYYINIYFT